MKIRNLFALALLIGASSAMAVEIPSIGPLLGIYKGDCKILSAGAKFIAPTEVKIERDSDRVKISLTSIETGETSVTSLKPNVEDVEVDINTNTKETKLLAITDAQPRKWTLTSRLSHNEYDNGLDEKQKTVLDFSNASTLKMKGSGTLGGVKSFSSTCDLEKMNIRIK